MMASNKLWNGGSCCSRFFSSVPLLLLLLLCCFPPPVTARRLQEKEETNKAAPLASNARIVGGSNADPTRYPYYTLLQIETASANGIVYQCGASLIAPDMVLSAAHCLYDIGFVTRITAIVNYTQDVYKLGWTGYEHSRQSVSELRHSSYNPRNDINDILLLQLDSPVPDVPLVQVNADATAPSDGESLTVVGFGVQSYTSLQMPLHLQAATINVISHSDCNDADSYTGRVIDSRMVCAAAPGKDSCLGDSGGPLIMASDDGTADVQVGITSWGKECARTNYPGVYTRVSAYAKTWIHARVCTVSDYPPTACPGVVGLLAPTPTATPTRFPTTNQPTMEPTTMEPTMEPTTKRSTVSSVHCFTGNMIVTVRDKGPILMKDLRIGDFVLVSPQVYEVVYSFGHFTDASSSSSSATYLKLEPSGLQLSANHMVFRQVDEEEAVPASIIQVGDVLLDGFVGDHHRVAVTSITRVSSRGMYAPLTASGKIVVNGVVCSTYISFQEDSSTLLIGTTHASYSTGISFQWLCHVFELPHRLWCQYLQKGEERYNEQGIATSVVPQLDFFSWLLERVWLQVLFLIPLLTMAVALHLLEQLMLAPLLTVAATLLLMLVGISSFRTNTQRLTRYKIH